MVEIQILSADVTALLDELFRRGIPLYDIRRNEFEVSFSVDDRDTTAVEAVADRRGDRIKSRGQSATRRYLRILSRHPILILGILWILAMTMYLPTRILFVRVEGNANIPTAQILEQSEACGIRFGAVRGEIRNEEVKNHLLDHIPALQWVGVNTRGCVVMITVKERQTEPDQADGRTADMVARCDALIRGCTVSRGTAQCKVGQTVRAGELLISGYADCGGVILHQRAQGEILGETNRQIMASAPDQWMQRGGHGTEIRKFSLRIGKNQINFFQGSGILDGSCVKMEREYKLTLPGGFELPVSLIETMWYYPEAEPVAGDAASLLAASAEEYLKDMMIAGQILDRRISLDGNTLYGNYVCLEIIGQLRYEENTIDYGKSDGTNSQR